MARKAFIVTLKVYTDKHVPDLGELVAQRAYTIDGVVAGPLDVTCEQVMLPAEKDIEVHPNNY